MTGRRTITAPPGIHEHAAHLYTRGTSITEVAQQIGYSYEVTRRFLIEAGITLRHGGPIQASNVQRGWNNSGRAPSGHQPSKLTPKQRDEIRQRLADDETPQALAVEYGVSVHTIYRYRA
jgi:transposase